MKKLNVESVCLKWEKVVTLKDSCFEFLFPGIYIHFFESKQTKRIVYIGRSDNISQRQYKYYSSYYDSNKLADFTYYNIALMKEEPNYYTCKGNYKNSVNKGLIIPGGSQPENIEETKVFNLRKLNADKTFVTAARLDDLEQQNEVESMFQLYFIDKYSMDPYYGKCFPIGYTGRKLQGTIERINNKIPPDKDGWFIDLPDTISSSELKRV